MLTQVLIDALNIAIETRILALTNSMTEGDVQDCVAIELRNNFKAYREARYPGLPQSIDVVFTDGADESWIEIKIIKDLRSLRMNRTKMSNDSQGISGKIRNDLAKLAMLPAGSERWFLCVGLFEDLATSLRANVANAHLGPSTSHNFKAPSQGADCNEIAFWWHRVR